ncbi:MAG: PQQ-binding-like beta-propeller repeat protein, partial [Planctomycetia bacterium]|nr:PQQ-binding-like beta-propeller repeat protein [Planctomycetia bacterium]
ARSLSARDLSPVGTWPLDAALAWPPAVVGGRCYLADATGGVLALGEDGQRLWSARSDGTNGRGAVAGPPAVRGPTVWFLTRDGALHARRLEDGTPSASFAVGTLPAGGPLAVGDDLAVPVGLGSVRLLLDPKSTETGTPTR